MDSIELEFEKYLMQELTKEVEKATKETEQVLKDKLDSNLYSAYDPVEYNRTENLKYSITSSSTQTEGKIYFDESKLNHTSAVTGEAVKLVPIYVNYGHSDGIGQGMFHEYPGRNFVEETVKTMENNEEYKNILKFEIKND